MMDSLVFPAWIFDNPGSYFMVGIEPNGRVRIDGGHSKPKDVAEAKYLHESISIIKPPDGTKFCMVKIEEIPDFRGRHNREAIRVLNQNLK